MFVNELSKSLIDEDPNCRSTLVRSLSPVLACCASSYLYNACYLVAATSLSDCGLYLRVGIQIDRHDFVTAI